MAAWTTNDIPSQTHRTAIVTGTGGLGYETALALAQAGATVVLAGRNPAKGAASLAQIKSAAPAAEITFEELDLASLASIAAFADRMPTRLDHLDLLVNNAGVMMPPKRGTTSDGFELQFGTNHLGHFALTARLLPLLRQGNQARIVNVSSIAHRRAAIHFHDLQWERAYRPWASYGQSKLAVLMFALELQRRSDAGGWGLISNAAHPGYARTSLFTNGPGADNLKMKLSKLVQPFISQSAAAGALPLLYAATAPEAVGGAYYRPDGFLELKGAPTLAKIMPQAKDKAASTRLWDISQRLAGVAFP